MNRLIYPGLLALTVGLSACGSAPVHYHTLLAPAVATTGAEPAAPFLIEVLPVGLPPQLDQPQLTVRQGDSGIAILDGERWAGPLGDELRAALSAELSTRLSTQDIAGLPGPAGKALLRIKLEVRRFDAWPGRKVELAADWSLSFAEAPASPRLLCHGDFAAAAAGGGYPQLAEAGQRAIAALAARIGADARNLAGRRPSCSAPPAANPPG